MNLLALNIFIWQVIAAMRARIIARTLFLEIIFDRFRLIFLADVFVNLFQLAEPLSFSMKPKKSLN